MDEARVIPLHPEAGDGPRRAVRRALARRDTDRDASIYRFDAADAASEADPGDEPLTGTAVAGWEQRLADLLGFARRRARGDYQVDEFGFDRELTDSVMVPLLAPLYDRWFRVEVCGAEHLPGSRGALLVANHAGGIWPLDAAMTALAVHRNTPAHRHLRMLGAELLFATPGVSTLARRTGTTLACRADAARLLAAGELVGVWPEGFAGLGKPFRERYQLRRFNRFGDFVRAAMEAGVPIVPVSIVGAEEIHPVLANVKPLARLLDLPYLPITPTFPLLGPLGLVPLPSKWQIVFGAPVDLGRDADPGDAALVDEVTDEVRERLQTSLYRLLVQRRSVWR